MGYHTLLPPRFTNNIDIHTERRRSGNGCRSTNEQCPHSHRLPVDIWEEIFIRCLPPPEDLNAPISDRRPITRHEAPLLLCQVCSSWRRVAMSLPALWYSLRVFVSSGKANPDAKLASQWLERSGCLPLSLLLYQENGSNDNRAAAGKILDIYKRYIHRWRGIQFCLSRPQASEPSSQQECNAPLLEHLSIKLYGIQEDSEQVLFHLLHQTPKLSTLSMSDLSHGKQSNMSIPWNQLTSVSIDLSISVGEALGLLNEGHNIKRCILGIERIPSVHPTSAVPVVHTILQTLEISAEGEELATFLEYTTLPALFHLAIHGRRQPGPHGWPQDQLNGFLCRSEIRLHYLGLFNTWIRNNQFLSFMQHPAAHSIVDLVFKDESDWLFPPYLNYSTLNALRYDGHPSTRVLPALESLKILGSRSLWSIDSKALVDMVESRWRSSRDDSSAHLRSLEVQMSPSCFPEDCCRLREFQTEGLELYLVSHP